jgi:hypothetical protein
MAVLSLDPGEAGKSLRDLILASMALGGEQSKTIEA